MKSKKYLFLIILLFIASLNFNLFLKPLKIVCGGTQGLAIVINKIIYIDYYYIILIINTISFIISIIFLNKKTTIGLIITTFFYPIFIKLTNSFTININNYFINIMLTGLISGLTNGLIYKLGFTLGGINVIGLLISKYCPIKIGTINFIINFLIIILGLSLFGFKNFVLAIIVIIINSLTINYILYNKKNIKKYFIML